LTFFEKGEGGALFLLDQQFVRDMSILSSILLALKRAAVGYVKVTASLLAAGVLGDGLGAFTIGVLGQLTGEKQTDSGVCSCSLDNVPVFTVMLAISQYFQDGGRDGGVCAWKFWREILATKKNRQHFSGVSKIKAGFISQYLLRHV
jgi:hypothetical protein